MQVLPLALLAAGTAIGWGLVYNGGYAHWLRWQGYLFDPFGLGSKTGPWGGAGLGVLVALVIGYLGTLLFSRSAVRRQEQR